MIGDNLKYDVQWDKNVDTQYIHINMSSNGVVYYPKYISILQ